MMSPVNDNFATNLKDQFDQFFQKPDQPFTHMHNTYRIYPYDMKNIEYEWVRGSMFGGYISYPIPMLCFVSSNT